MAEDDTPTVPAPVRRSRPQAPKRPNTRYIEARPPPPGVSHGVTYHLNEAGYSVVAAMAAGGHSQASIAAKLGMDPSTFTTMKKRDPLLQDALNRGHGLLEDEVVTTLVEHMRSGNVASAIFLAKGKVGMREVGPTDPNQVAPAVQVNIVAPPALTAEQVAALLGRPVPEPITIEHDDEAS